jgi:hypothetical protein
MYAKGQRRRAVAPVPAGQVVEEVEYGVILLDWSKLRIRKKSSEMPLYIGSPEDFACFH